MSKQPDITIDRKCLANIGKVVIILKRTDRPELDESHFKIDTLVLAKAYKELNISNDYGALERMEEVIGWLSQNSKVEPGVEDILVIKD